MDAWRQVEHGYLDRLQADPKQREAFDNLAALYRKEEQWSALAELLAQWVHRGHVTGKEKLSAQEDLAELYQDHLQDSESAIDVWVSVLQALPDHDKALRALETLIWDTPRKTLVAKLLLPYFEQRSEHSRRADMLQLLIDAELEGGAAKVGTPNPYRLQLAAHYEQNMSRLDDAFEQWLALAKEAGPSQQAWEGLLRCISTPAQHEALTEQTRHWVQSHVRNDSSVVSDSSERLQAVSPYVEYWVQHQYWQPLIELIVELLNGYPQESGWIVLFQQMIDATPEKLYDVQWWRLQSIQLEAQARRRLIEGLEHRLQNGRLALVLTRATMKEGETMTSEDMENVERLAQQEGDREALVTSLRAQLESTDDAGLRVTMARRLADTLRQDAGHESEILTLLAEVAEARPDDKATLEAMLDLAMEHRDGERFKVAADGLLRLMSGGSERDTLLNKVLDYEFTHLQSFEAGTRRLVEHFEAGESLEQLYAFAEKHYSHIPAAHRVSLCETISNRSKRDQDWKHYELWVDRLLEEVNDPISKVEWLIDSAKVLGLKLQKPEAGFDRALQAAIEKPDDHRAEQVIEDIGREGSHWQQAVSALEKLYQSLSDETRARSLARRISMLAAEQLGNNALATQYLERGYQDDELPHDAAGLALLEDRSRQNGDAKKLAQILEARLQSEISAVDTQGADAIRLEISELYAQQLNEPALALKHLQKIAETSPLRIEALHKIVGLQEVTQQQDALAETLVELVAAGARNSELIDDCVRLAKHYISLNQYDEALKILRQALLKDRDAAPVLELLESLVTLADDQKESIAQLLAPIYTASQNYEKLAWLTRARLAAVTDPNDRKSLWRRLGDIYDTRLLNKEQAFAVAREAFGEDPVDMGTRMWLEKSAANADLYRELVFVYADEAKNVDNDTALSFLHRAAVINKEKLQDAAAAANILEEVLAKTPDDEKALSSLEDIYRSENDYLGLSKILANRAENAKGIERRRLYLNQQAEVLRDHLHQPEQAIEVYRTLLSIDPDDEEAFSALEVLLEDALLFDALIELYKQESERLKEFRGKEAVQRKATLAFRLGKLYDQRLSNIDEAVQAFTEALDIEPEHAATLMWLREHGSKGQSRYLKLLDSKFEKDGEPQAQAKNLEQWLENESDPKTRRSLFLRLAELYSERLVAPDLAFQAVARAFDEQRNDAELVEKLYSVAAEAGMWDGFVAIVGSDPDRIPDPQLRQHVLKRLGAVVGEHLGDLDRAVEYLIKVLDYEPRDAEALDALDAIYSRHQRWADLAKLLERRLEVAETSQQKSAILERLARVWANELKDPEAALRCHQQIMELDPEHPLSLQEMEKLYRELEDWDQLASNLLRQAQRVESDEERLRVHRSLATLYAEELDSNQESIAHWERVLALKADAMDAYEQLDVLYAIEDQWEKLSDLLRHKIQFVDEPAARVDLTQRIGIILKERLGRDDDALGAWEEVREQDAKNVEALQMLCKLYRERARWKDFASVAQDLMPLGEPEEAKQLRLELAEVLGRYLEDPQRSLVLAREFRTQEPHKAENLWRLARLFFDLSYVDDGIAALRLGAKTESETNPEQSQRFYKEAIAQWQKADRILEARADLEALLKLLPDDEEHVILLQQVYRSTEHWRELVALDEQYLGYVDEPQARRELLEEIRSTQEQHLGEKDFAFIAACRLFKEDPSDLNYLNDLERLGRITQSLEEAAAVIEDEVESAPESAQVRLLDLAARLYDEDLQDYASCESLLEALIKLDPKHIVAYDRLASIGAKDDRFDKQISALERKFKAVDSDDNRKSILFEMARVWEDQLGDADEAIEALLRILEIDGADRSALDGLSRLYEAEERYNDLAQILTRVVGFSGDLEEQIALRFRVAQICEGKLDDAATAIEWYRAVLELQPENEEALSALERLFTSLERWSELLQVFERRINQTEDVEQKNMLLGKMAAIYENEFEAPAEAAQCYEHVIALSPTNDIALHNLQRLLQQTRQWDRLVQVLELDISRHQETDVAKAISLYLQMGDIYYREMARVDQAERIYLKARELDPSSVDALAALGRLYERSGNWFEAREMLQQEAELHKNNDAALVVWARIGRINEDMLADSAAAQSAYERALQIDPHFEPALEALRDISSQQHDWVRYAALLLTQAEATDDTEDKAELFAQLAKYYHETQNDFQNAVLYYKRALDIDAEHLDARRSLGDVYFESDAWEDASAVYRDVVARLDKTDHAQEYCQRHYRLGYIAEKQGASDQALFHYQEAYEADATYLPALEGLGQALFASEAWEEAQKTFQTILLHHRDALTESEAVDLQVQFGEAALKQKDLDTALKQFEKALQIDPEHSAALSLSADVQESKQNWDAAYRLLERYVQIGQAPDRRAAILRMADLAADKLEDTQRAIASLERARRMNLADADALERLAEAYLSNHQTAKAVDALQAACEKAHDAAQKSGLWSQLGQIFQHQVQNEPRALQCYEQAIEAWPDNIEAFAALEKLLGSRQQWGLLEECYRKMLGLLGTGSSDRKLVLWRGLAELYDNALHRPEAAALAFEAMRELGGLKEEDKSRLAKLYAVQADRVDDAVNLYQQILDGAENPVEAIRALRQLYHGQQRFDAVYLMAAALNFMGVATDEEKQIYEYLGRGVPNQAASSLGEEEWKLIRHPDLNGPIGQFAAQLFKVGHDAMLESPKKLGLKPKDRIDIRQSDLLVARLAQYCTNTLNQSLTDIFVKAQSMEGIRFVATIPPALTVGANHELFRNPSQTLVARFTLGRYIAAARADTVLARLHPQGALRDLLIGACSIFNESLVGQGNPKIVQAWGERFRGIPRQAHERLLPYVEAASEALLTDGALTNYLRAVEFTVDRAAMVVTGSFPAAHRAMSEDDDPILAISLRERTQDLVRWTLSPQAMTIRQAIGTALVTKTD